MIMLVCVVCQQYKTYKNAIGHKSCVELLLNICVNVLFTRTKITFYDDLLRKFAIGFVVSLFLVALFLVVSK